MKRITEDPNMALRLVGLCEATFHLAVDGGMPDSYWETDSRITFARETLIAQVGKREAAKLERAIREGDAEFAPPVFKDRP